jgi:hypothetical protein
MIANAFSDCPQALWITLWETCAQARQVLDSAKAALFCAFFRQAEAINEIKDLQDPRAITDSWNPGHDPHCSAAYKLGISQA